MKSTIQLLFFFALILSVLGCRIQSTPPELISLSDRQALVGKNITLTGHQFGSAPVVLFGVATSIISATIVSNDDNSITVKVPYVAPGLTQIRVQTEQGTTDPLPFIVLQPSPEVVSITPTNGLPGTEVVITGDFLNRIKSIRFDGVNAIIKDTSAQKLIVQIPSNVPRGSSSVSIETQGGLFTSSFIVAGTPQITSLSPLKTRPGAPIVIKGVNLSDGVVLINGRSPDKTQTTVSDSEIRTVVPIETPSGLVTVTVFDKLVATSKDTLQIYQPPVIARLSEQNVVAGDKIIVEGRNLSTVSALSFGNVTATFRVLSDTQLEAVVPLVPSSAATTVSVSSLGGNATSSVSLFVYLAPSDVTFTPTRQIRGWSITATGKNFYRLTDVRLNGISAPITATTEGTSVTFNVPTNAMSGPITIANRAGLSSSAALLVVVQNPVVSSFLPAKAQVGQRVVIQGDFLLNAQIFFAGSLTPAVDGGKITDTERWVLVPSGAQTGPLRVLNETNNATTTPTSFTVLP
ncbi:IPT/TIG domain-containing protein [Spirosoma validum]|uniref:IPT/TIG domain-containing protein n=1 Tax=Spirosoma validum TaxID=2771355 RepID=A0A927AXQ5_9BACT|nr:IPT/TIG domain-containing protein [Spirosoma validum]MBD2751680.1 IPT/TIG domain-containing protein [Spirosoma validum]